MKKLNVLIKDKNTLELLEDAKKGDIIDLSSLNSVDTEALSSALEASKDRAIDAKINAALELEKVKNESSKIEIKTEYEIKIRELEAKIKASDEARNLELKALEAKKNEEASSSYNKLREEYGEKINNLNVKIREYESSKEIEKKLADAKLNEAILEVDSRYKEQISELKNDALVSKELYEGKLKSMEDSHKVELKLKDEQIEQYKNFKLSLSTKGIGEDLEQYCLREFNKVRMGSFPNAYFEKDNDVVGGTKGDFVFKESRDDVEVLSIMFEMKNEADLTASKHKNEDFYEKLDSDRRKKGCEYAVLVTMLEPENDYFNAGIVDVSYRYEKMFVVRPQCFIPLITLLRNAALSSLEAKRDLMLARKQELDVTMFEDKLNEFKSQFGKNYETAVKYFGNVIDDIDATIKKLEKMKDDLTTTGNQLRLANNKVADITVKKLTHGNPTMKAKFEENK